MGRRRRYLAVVLLAAAFPAAPVGCATRAAAPTLPALPAGVSPDSREGRLATARGLAVAGARDEARTIYRALLAADAADDEARAGLARVDAWAGRYADAEMGYRAVLVRHPDDPEVRAGLVDTLLWRGRWSDARAELDRGLQRAPDAAPLLERLARLHAWRGEAASARAAIDRAARSAPDDDALQAARDRVFVGEARVVGREDFFPAGYANTRALDVFVSHSLGRLMLSAHTEQSQRLATGGTIYNGLYHLGVGYTFGVGWGLGVEAGVGAPSPVVPSWTVRATASAPLGRMGSASVAYAYWSYTPGHFLHLVNPTIIFSPSDALRLEARYWLAVVSLPTVAATAVHSAGLRVAWRPTPRLEGGVEYTYGSQIDRVPTVEQMLALTSHIGGVSVDWLASRAFGLRPLYRIEHRRVGTAGATVLIHSLELAAYTRW